MSLKLRDLPVVTGFLSAGLLTEQSYAQLVSDLKADPDFLRNVSVSGPGGEVEIARWLSFRTPEDQSDLVWGTYAASQGWDYVPSRDLYSRETLKDLFESSVIRRIRALPFEGPVLVSSRPDLLREHAEVKIIGRYKTAFARPTDIDAVIERDFSASLEASKVSRLQANRGIDKRKIVDLNKIEDSSSRDIFRLIFERAIDVGASDIHIEMRENDTLVRLRIDGKLQSFERFTEGDKLVNFVKNLADMDVTVRRRSQDGRITLTVGHGLHEVRAVAIPLSNGLEKIVLRILASEMSMLPLEGIGLADRNLDVLKRRGVEDQGMILVTGPTGSGKSTTLYSLINYIMDEKTVGDDLEVNIVTAEDPVEFRMEGVNQTQISREEDGVSFLSALRSFLRADPDVILIGEMRDSETASTAFEASNTGHMVLSTMHTKSAPSTIRRALELGVDPASVADAISVAVAQRLVSRLCTVCRVRRPATLNDFRGFEVSEKKIVEQINNGLHVYDANPSGCTECVHGFSGRLAIHELIEMNSELGELIAKRKEDVTTAEIEVVARKNGYRTMREDGLVKALQGLTTLIEVRHRTSASETAKERI